MPLYGYIRTSRQHVKGVAGGDPRTQELQLVKAGVPLENVYRDVGVSGTTGTNTRRGWRALDKRMGDGDVLVVASVDRIGRRWIDTISVIRDLRQRRVRIRSLAEAEQAWTKYLDANPDTIEAFFGDAMASFCAYIYHQEQESISRRTKAGLDRARAAGKTLGQPRKMTEEKLAAATAMRREGKSYNQIARTVGLGATTVRDWLGPLEK